MRRSVLKQSGRKALLVAIIGSVAGCQTSTNTNMNTNATANMNTGPANVNANVSRETISTIAAREPERYRATMVFSAETEGGERTVGIPTLSAEVARNGPDRRVSFKLPDGSDLIYLEHAGQHYVIAPGRKQYAELTPEATGFQIHKLLTPGQLVSYLEKLKGVERVGEEAINGRAAEKYRYAVTTKTGTTAGALSTEAFVYVDKDTGLPLRSELFTEASGSVQGVKAAKIVAEMRGITTDVDSSLFEVPAGLNKVPPQQVRTQIDAFTSTVAALIKALLTNIGATTTTTTTSPAAAASSSP
jgi:hypothetical protein